MKTLDQIRAQYAWGCVQGIDAKYKNLSKGLPALVMSNGLMQTLAFLQGKAEGGNEHQKIIKHILEWLGRPDAQVFTNDRCRDFASAMEALSECDSLLYQRATEETLNLLKWIRYLAATVA